MICLALKLDKQPEDIFCEIVNLVASLVSKIRGQLTYIGIPLTIYVKGRYESSSGSGDLQFLSLKGRGLSVLGK